MKNHRNILALCLLLASTGACTSEVGHDGSSNEDTNSAEPVNQGQLTTDFPEVVLLDGFQSVDEFKQRGGFSCTGTLIAPRVVLTAAHCVFGASFWTITAPLLGQATTSTKGLLADPGFSLDELSQGEVSDVAAVVLDEPITPAQFPNVQLDRIPSGTRAVLIGRVADVLQGQTNGGQYGEVSNSKVFVSAPVALKDGTPFGNPNELATSRVGQSGDSGGPLMLAGTHTIVSVESRFDLNVEFDPRLDLAAGFIKALLGQNGAP